MLDTLRNPPGQDSISKQAGVCFSGLGHYLQQFGLEDNAWIKLDYMSGHGNI